MMKYLQLKYTILFLQRNKFIGKYCFYGCWCLPASADFENIGYGQPVDEIDHSCREFATCYNCVYNQKINGKQRRGNKKCSKSSLVFESCHEVGTCNLTRRTFVLMRNLPPKKCDESDKTRYSIKGVADKETKKITLFCTDPIGSCLRSRCECDKSLAEKLASHESTWNRGYHHKWGNPPFNPEESCRAPQQSVPSIGKLTKNL